MPLQTALRRVRDAPFLLDAIRAADDLTLAAGRDGGPHAVKVLTGAIAPDDDQLLSIAAVQALGAVFDDAAAAVLSDLLSDPHLYLREHAAWALGSRHPRWDAVGRLLAGVTSGGFATVINQRALRRWAQYSPDHIALAIEGALLAQQITPARARLVETMGLVPGALAERMLLRVAADESEPLPVRMTAVAALGDRHADDRRYDDRRYDDRRCDDRRGDDRRYDDRRYDDRDGDDRLLDGHRHQRTGADRRGADRSDNAGRAQGDTLDLLRQLADGSGDLAGVARLAQFDLTSSGRPSEPAVERSGLTIAQLFLHADLDRELSRAGAGDNGGIATMLVRLGDALVREPGIERVLTMSRGSVGAAIDQLEHPVTGHALAPVPLLAEPTGTANAWPLSVAAERGIRRVLTAHAPVDVLHLRMAEVGSMAAAAVATRLGIPTVFTLAPDPHAVVHALDMTGALNRRDFGTVDEREHYWFRTGLVHRLATGAHHNVLFPRPKLRDQLQDLLGVDIERDGSRYTVVPEGIDLSVTEAANHDAEQGSHPALAELGALIAALPEHRRGLPLALTVGRLHRVKGMATVVEAWASNPVLRARCNLLVVGGDLTNPSTDERGQLDLIATVLAEHRSATDGLILPGHRPNEVVARWMAATRHGLGDLVAPGGVYVCGSLKEEFGLALIEALAAGLVVVGPDGGGPATYIRHGVTGYLVGTRSPAAVGLAIVAALDLSLSADDDQRAAAAQRLVAERFTMQAMAQALAGVYAEVADAEVVSASVSAGAR